MMEEETSEIRLSNRVHPHLGNFVSATAAFPPPVAFRPNSAEERKDVKSRPTFFFQIPNDWRCSESDEPNKDLIKASCGQKKQNVNFPFKCFTSENKWAEIRHKRKQKQKQPIIIWDTDGKRVKFWDDSHLRRYSVVWPPTFQTFGASLLLLLTFKCFFVAFSQLFSHK